MYDPWKPETKPTIVNQSMKERYNRILRELRVFKDQLEGLNEEKVDSRSLYYTLQGTKDAIRTIGIYGSTIFD
jgi:hypothetical protein